MRVDDSISRWDTQALPILNTFVLQTGHTPLVAGLPFLRVTRIGFLISTFFLHFIQYAVAIVPSFGVDAPTILLLQYVTLVNTFGAAKRDL